MAKKKQSVPEYGTVTRKGDKFDSILIDIDQIASAERVITVNNAVQ